MTQFPKEEIRESIIAAAKDEFMKNGFERASIRTITAAAKTSKSNVYNYFHNKDDLFRAVVEPGVSKLEAVFQRFREKNPGSSPGAYSMATQRDAIQAFMEVIFTYHEEFKLLFISSAGSSSARFEDFMANELAAVLMDWVLNVAPDKGISDFFVRSVAGFYVDTIAQMLVGGVSPKDAGEHLDEFLRFVYGGWKTLLE